MPATSANLGPGFDVLAAAVDIELELEVEETGEYSFDPGGMDVPMGRDNLLVSSFERLHSADGISFRQTSAIPLARGLGSSAAAIVAGLMAADHLFELGNPRERLFELACEIEGHPDNVAAAMFGGFTVAAPEGAPERASAPDPIDIAAGTAPSTVGAQPALIAPPEGLEAVLVIPFEEVSTAAARAAMGEGLAIPDGVHNVAAAANLVLGIERSDLTLIERGLTDRIHQDRRAHLFPKSMEIVAAARGLGAIGATISGAGPTVLVWSHWQAGGGLLKALEERCEGWADVRRVPFSPHGARVGF